MKLFGRCSKKRILGNQGPHLKEMWVIPPKHNATFVYHLEDVLEVYQRPYDEARPLVCFDEQPTQLIREVREPLPPLPGQPERYDYEYHREGTAPWLAKDSCSLRP
jgi:hypothetical protein